MIEKIYIFIACAGICVLSIHFAIWFYDRPPFPKIEKQKVYRGEMVYKGEVITIILRERMEESGTGF